MQVWRAAVTGLVCVAAQGCGDNSRGYEVVAGEQALLVQYREDGGGWTSPAPISDGDGAMHYHLYVGSPFELLIVCPSAPQQNLVAWEYFVTPAELDDTTEPRFCGQVPYPQGRVHVSGQMVQPGHVQIMDFGADSSTGPWSYNFDVPPGVHDLVAYDRSGRSVIRHGLDLRSVTVEPILDTSQEGVMNSAAAFTVQGASFSEPLVSEGWLVTREGTTIQLGTTAAAVSALPASALKAGDRQSLDVFALGAKASRSAHTTFSALDRLLLTLPPAVPPVAYGASDVSVAWTDLPAVYTSFGFDDADDATARTQVVTMSHDWLASHPRSSMAFDTDVPGYQAAWMLDPTSSLYRDFFVRNNQHDVQTYAHAFIDPVSASR